MMPTLGRKVCPSLSGSSTEPSDDDDNENTENNELNKAIIEYKDEDGMMEDRGWNKVDGRWNNNNEERSRGGEGQLRLGQRWFLGEERRRTGKPHWRRLWRLERKYEALQNWGGGGYSWAQHREVQHQATGWPGWRRQFSHLAKSLALKGQLEQAKEQMAAWGKLVTRSWIWLGTPNTTPWTWVSQGMLDGAGQHPLSRPQQQPSSWL